mgnify:CR=1 FL=1|tara:strand:+ start:278 stop:775 length:498 start_codon:yes stop_codon:yes gene_type:complete
MALSKITTESLLDGEITAAKFATGVGGKILQLLSIKTNAAITSSATSFTATGLYLDITPATTSSKIYATLNGGGAYNTTQANTTQRVTIYRASTNLGHATYGLQRHSTPGGSHAISPHSLAVLDSPSSTSELRYEVYFSNADAAATVHFSTGDRGEVTLTVMEFA